MPSLRTTPTSHIDEGTNTSSPSISASRLGGSCFVGAFNKAIADTLQSRLRSGSSGVPMNEQQQAVLQWARNSAGCCNVIARAGTGKTTLLVELACQVSRYPQASTFHSLGLKLWNSLRSSGKFGDRTLRAEVISDKVRGLAYEIYPWNKLKPENRIAARALIDTVSKAKGAGFGLPDCPEIEDVQQWMEIIDFYDLAEDLPDVIGIEKLVDDCISVYHKSLDLCVNQNKIDYDDMILAPLYFGEARPEMFDWVLVDEAQDTSWTRFLLSKWVLKTGGRMVVVGDPKQSINLFAGAKCDAMDVIRTEMGAVEFPLSITYRCPKAVVRVAQAWVPEFTAHETAPEGLHTTLPHTQLWLQKFDPEHDVLLCRNTRPLAGIAERLRDQGLVCVVEGQSAKGLIKLATRWKDVSASTMLEKLFAYRDEEVEKFEKKGRRDKAERLADRVGILADVAAKCDTVAEVVSALEFKFGEGQNAEHALHLCTVHRAKGREWKRVFLIGRNIYMPSPWAKRDEELAQEENCEYTAVTRAKHELVDVECPPKKKKGEADWWEV